MSYKIETVVDPIFLGEGPHWDNDQQILYFVSPIQHAIHKYDPATGKHTRTTVDGDKVGFIVPVEGTSDQFIIAVDRKFVVVTWDGEDNTPVSVVKEIGEVDQDVPTNNINDGKADPRGRVYAGTMGQMTSPGIFEEHKASLYRVDRDKVTKIDTDISMSNGMAWDEKEKAMYYIDSLEKNIRRYDYDVETGDISNKTYIFDFEAHNLPGIPDGATIDTDGNLWVAVFDGSNVLKIDPRTGELLQTLPIPAKQVTSVIFGGPNHDILYVTTGSIDIAEKQPPPCGATFAVTGLGVRGLPNVHYKI